MRKLLAILLIFSGLSQAKGQMWLDVGVKGGVGFDMLYNKNINDDPEFNQQLSLGFNVGGKLGLNFNDFHELTFDFLYYSYDQKYKYNVLNPVDNSKPQYLRTVKFSGLDFLLMYRHNNDGRYVEIGPQLSLVKNIAATDDYPGSTFGSLDLTSQIAPNFTSIVFGFGSYLIGTENFGMTTGVRLSYSFSDLIADNGQTHSFPTNSSAYSATGPGSSLVDRSYASYTPTHVLTAMFIMEFNFDFAYLAKAKCSNKRKLVLF
ncbi:MAG: hypothetical protein ACHQF2_07545 [Flavobacteriales bacterium]